MNVHHTNLRSVNHSNTHQNYNLSPVQYGPNPNHPAYIFGKVIVRPALDMGWNLGVHVYTALQEGYVYADEIFSRAVNIFPGARATSVPENCVDPLLNYNSRNEMHLLQCLPFQEVYQNCKNNNWLALNKYDLNIPVPLEWHPFRLNLKLSRMNYFERDCIKSILPLSK